MDPRRARRHGSAARTPTPSTSWCSRTCSRRPWAAPRPPARTSRAEQARAALGSVRGPERILDLMLRAGPWGDRFDEDSDGLSLATLREAEHGIDLGPLEPRLPELLGTASGAIELAPGSARLRRAAPARGARRAPPAGQPGADRAPPPALEQLLDAQPAPAREGPRSLHAAGEPAATPRASASRTAAARGCKSRVGELVAPVAVSDEMMPGVVSLPHGFGHDAPGAQLAVAARVRRREREPAQRRDATRRALGQRRAERHAGRGGAGVISQRGAAAA